MGTEGVQSELCDAHPPARASAATVHYPAVDPILLLAAGMLIAWGVGTWLDGPGWIHILLTAGVFLLVWRIVTKGRANGGTAAKPN
jgi:hypothetical protein